MAFAMAVNEQPKFVGDADGVRVVVFPRSSRRRRWQAPVLITVLGIIAVAGLWWRSQREGSSWLQVTDSNAPLGQQRAAVEAPALPRHPPQKTVHVELRARPRDSAPQPPAAPPVPDARSEPRGAAAAIDSAEQSADEPSGIALFPPPGTNPPKSGLVVPDDFELPAGYVRHYQVTDDGKPLPPILMFHPDAELFDAQGNPIPLPPDRVVPPELAPPGFPIEVLEVPQSEVPYIELPPADHGTQ
jgi:hypothetical protein